MTRSPGDDPLSPATLRASLLASVAQAEGAARVLRVGELSQGLAASRVVRVVIDDLRIAGVATRSLILKLPDWGESAVRPRDPLVPTRERLFIEHGLAAHLPSGLHTPRALGVERRDGRSWIWMEDVADALATVWDVERAARAAALGARLHLMYRERAAALDDADWLSRAEYAAYADHVPAAHGHLDALTGHPTWGDLFSGAERAALHRLLDALDAATDAMRALPPTFIHGDFHVRNLGFAPDGALVLLDWAHAGIAPLGCDPATLVSVFRLFGGRGGDVARDGGGPLDEAVADAYERELARIAGLPRPMPEVRRAIGLWHATWGLHLRLGPGLAALLGDHIPDAAERARAATDIREGAWRALAFSRAAAWPAATLRSRTA